MAKKTSIMYKLTDSGGYEIWKVVDNNGTKIKEQIGFAGSSLNIEHVVGRPLSATEREQISTGELVLEEGSNNA